MHTELNNIVLDNHSSVIQSICLYISVAIQCLEAAYDIFRHDGATEASYPLPAGGLQEVFNAGIEKVGIERPTKKAVSDTDKLEADKQKVRGNELMKEEKYEDALKCYDEAIRIDDQNAVYFCNRLVL